ncbi:hypothetical protein TRIUR3_09215 [Triticum urartu]|uniref:Uncharacterized protein n=1 Tax=Triticum urartu TaxID=4572 RepID=M7ZZR3_TRIUA|nr:hypothetical protein TRIUR3_09215 [Triticum urartu]
MADTEAAHGTLYNPSFPPPDGGEISFWEEVPLGAVVASMIAGPSKALGIFQTPRGMKSAMRIITISVIKNMDAT